MSQEDPLFPSEFLESFKGKHFVNSDNTLDKLSVYDYLLATLNGNGTKLQKIEIVYELTSKKYLTKSSN